jgi:hypothetical protein
MTRDTNRDAEAANAKASAEKLQDAAHGGPPVAIPGAFEPEASPAPEQRAPTTSDAPPVQKK